MLPLRPALLPKRYRGGSAPRSRPGRAAARATAAGGGEGRGGGGSTGGDGSPAPVPRGGAGSVRVPVRRRGPGSPRAARRGAEQEPPRPCARWPVGAAAAPRRARGGGAGGRGARPGRAAAAASLLLAQPAAAMAAVLSPRLCDSDPATPGAQSLKVRAGGGDRGAAAQQPPRREASRGPRAGAPRPAPLTRPAWPGLTSRPLGEPGCGGWPPAPWAELSAGLGPGARGRPPSQKSLGVLPGAARQLSARRGSAAAGKVWVWPRAVPHWPCRLLPRIPGTAGTCGAKDSRRRSAVALCNTSRAV